MCATIIAELFGVVQGFQQFAAAEMGQKAGGKRRLAGADQRARGADHVGNFGQKPLFRCIPDGGKFGQHLALALEGKVEQALEDVSRRLRRLDRLRNGRNNVICSLAVVEECRGLAICQVAVHAEFRRHFPDAQKYRYELGGDRSDLGMPEHSEIRVGGDERHDLAIAGSVAGQALGLDRPHHVLDGDLLGPAGASLHLALYPGEAGPTALAVAIDGIGVEGFTLRSVVPALRDGEVHEIGRIEEVRIFGVIDRNIQNITGTGGANGTVAEALGRPEALAAGELDHDPGLG